MSLMQTGLLEASNVVLPPKEPCREILLKGDKYVALVDEPDYERLASFQWIPLKVRGGTTIYAIRYVPEKGKTKRAIFMHREVLGLSDTDKIKVFHVRSSETLDNRRSNLLIGTKGTDYKQRLGIAPVSAGICPVCGEEFKTYPSRTEQGRGKFCSKKCYKVARSFLPPKFIPSPATCEGCGLEFMKRRQNMRFCTERCEKKNAGSRFITNSTEWSPQKSGEIAELKVVIDLLNKGYWVFKPVTFGCGFDYIATRDDTVERVEVRVGRIHGNSGYVHTNRRRGKHRAITHTLLAIVIGDLIIYERPEKEGEKL